MPKYGTMFYVKLVSWNINGIRAVQKKGLLEPFFQKLAPDVACFQETKAHRHQFNKARKDAGAPSLFGETAQDGSDETEEVTIPGYKEYWNSADKSGYAGTAIFSKTEPLAVVHGIPAELVEKFHVKPDQFGDPNAEGRVIMAEYKGFYVVNVYTPNSKRELSRLDLRHKHWDPAIRAYCAQLDQKKPVLFCGDLNVAHAPDDLANPKANEGEHGYTKEEREGIDLLLKEGFVDTFRVKTAGSGHYSWWSHFANSRIRNVGWRLDYIFASERVIARMQSAKIHSDIYGSDHCPVSVEIDI
jgi:exodeoxyribonuclease-3